MKKIALLELPSNDYDINVGQIVVGRIWKDGDSYRYQIFKTKITESYAPSPFANLRDAIAAATDRIRSQLG